MTEPLSKGPLSRNLNQVLNADVCNYSTEVNLIITLLLEVDVILFPKPGVGQVARIRLRLAGEECILGYVYSHVFWW